MKNRYFFSSSVVFTIFIAGVALAKDDPARYKVKAEKAFGEEKLLKIVRNGRSDDYECDKLAVKGVGVFGISLNRVKELKGPGLEQGFGYSLDYVYSKSAAEVLPVDSAQVQCMAKQAKELARAYKMALPAAKLLDKEPIFPEPENVKLRVLDNRSGKVNDGWLAANQQIRGFGESYYDYELGVVLGKSGCKVRSAEELLSPYSTYAASGDISGFLEAKLASAGKPAAAPDPKVEDAVTLPKNAESAPDQKSTEPGEPGSEGTGKSQDIF